MTKPKTKTQKAAKPSKATKKPAAPVAVAAPKSAAAVAGTITVTKASQKYDGARAAWYGALLAHDGKPAESFVADCLATPPATPKSGKAEDPRGWLRWFVRERIASLA